MAEAEVTGLREVVARIEQIRRRAGNLKAPLKDSAEHMVASLELNIDAGGRPPFVPLADSTKAHKSGSILNESGTMRGSNEPIFEADGWTIVNTDPKSVFHLKGTKSAAGKEKMPARNWMLFQPEDVTAIGTIFFDHILQ